MRKSILGLSIVAGLMAMSGAAFAGPTTTVDGITIPIGQNATGYVIDTESSAEVLVQNVGDEFFGVFDVGFIKDSNLTTVWTSGQNNAYLYGTFTGFKTTAITPNPDGSITLLFNGGQLSYYTSSTDHFQASGGTGATDLDKQKSDVTATAQGNLFLQATPQQIDALGNTLRITIPAGGSLTSFGGQNAQATANTVLDVTGGDAFYNFNTNSLNNNGFNNGHLADIAFFGQASSGVAGDFGVSGTNSIKANTVPEPVTLSLFGAGLFGVAALRRRKKKQA